MLSETEPSAVAPSAVAVEGVGLVLSDVPCGTIGRIAELMIWLSRLPTDAPSAAAHLMWYGPPLTLDAPRPVPQPSTWLPAARWPPKSSCTVCWPLPEVTKEIFVEA